MPHGEANGSLAAPRGHMNSLGSGELHMPHGEANGSLAAHAQRNISGTGKGHGADSPPAWHAHVNHSGSHPALAAHPSPSPLLPWEGDLDDEIDAPPNDGHSQLIVDCLVIATCATLVLFYALRRANRAERQAFIDSFVLRCKVNDQRQLLVGDRIELLALFSNPSVHSGLNLQPLKLGKELKSLLEAIPSVFTAVQPAATLHDVRVTLRQHNPQIALFSGHCFMDRLAFELPSGCVDLPSSADLISALNPTLNSRLRCVVLNGCRTSNLAADIVCSIPQIAVICWSSLAEDSAARAFARGLYDHIGSALLTSGTFDLRQAYLAGFQAFIKSGYVYGDPAQYAHPPSHQHLQRPSFTNCIGCCPPVHGCPVLLFCSDNQLHICEGSSTREFECVARPREFEYSTKT